MKMETLQDLLLDQMKDLYDAEHQIVDGLRQMIQSANSQQLKQAFQTHLQETQGQIQRLEQGFQLMNMRPERKTCKAMQGLIKEAQELLQEKPDKDVLDAGMIAAAQRIEHYEIAGYGTAAAYARQIGIDQLNQLFEQTLREERHTDELLTQLAESHINIRASQ